MIGTSMTSERPRRPSSRLQACAALVCAAVVALTPAIAAAQGAGAALLRRTAKSQPDASVTTVASRSRAKQAVPAATPAKPSLAGTYGDWGVYLSQGAKSKICYALAQPKERTPASLKRDSSYVFISNRPGEGIRGEVSIIMGVALKDGAEGGRADIGSAHFDLVAKGQNAFVKNAAEEGQFVDALKRRGSRLTIKIASAKGPVASDSYSLAGLAPALERVAKECP